MSNVIFVVSSQVVSNNSKVNWPDSNYPGTCETILRTLHMVDYEGKRIQLDGADSPWIKKDQLPARTGFYKKI
jgi:hypothetical protein